MKDDSAYRALARVLDAMPQGFPATESGVEIDILEKLFSADEARAALSLSLEARSPKEAASLSGRDEAELRAHFKSMVKKGLIEFERIAGGIGYKLMPFVVGFYERQGSTMDAEFAGLFEKYYKEALVGALTTKPSSHRVIPVEFSIPMGIEIMPYERASTYLNAAAAWGVLDCICRVQKRLVGEGCRHSVENCLALSPHAGAFDQASSIRALRRDEATEILKAAAAEGLVHTTSNTQEGVSYICNCCGCACGFLRSAKDLGRADPVARSSFLCEVDPATCSGCGACIDACQFGALSMDGEGRCVVDAARCFGCGVCSLVCTVGALALRMKEGAMLEPPPIADRDWAFARNLGRGSRKAR